MNIYIASTLKNAPRVRRVRDTLKSYGINLSYDWTNSIIEEENKEQKRAVAELELNGVQNAQAILAIMPGGRGTHFELGYAYLLGKPIILLIDEMIESYIAFYHLPNITIANTEEIAIKLLLNQLGVSHNDKCTNN